jgi:hypothetical protein
VPDEERQRRLRELRQELLAYYPGSMPRSRLVLMDVDPATLHAYWSIDPDYLSGLRRRHRTPSAPLVLRLHALNGFEPERHREFELEGLTNNRYVTLWGEGRTYLGQIGLKTRRSFISVATSGAVKMPEMVPPPPPPPPAPPQVRSAPPQTAAVPAGEKDAGAVQVQPVPGAEEPVQVQQLQTEREELIRSRYQELAERAAAGGAEGLEASEPPKETPTFQRSEPALSPRFRQPAGPGGHPEAGRTPEVTGAAPTWRRLSWSSLNLTQWVRWRK